jgi:hypothetical protein
MVRRHPFGCGCRKNHEDWAIVWRNGQRCVLGSSQIGGLMMMKDA